MKKVDERININRIFRRFKIQIYANNIICHQWTNKYWSNPSHPILQASISSEQSAHFGASNNNKAWYISAWYTTGQEITSFLSVFMIRPSAINLRYLTNSSQ